MEAVQAKLLKMVSQEMNPKYPIYIPSKNRFDSRLTSKALERLKVPYYIVIEPHQYDNYAEHIDKSKILTLPWSKPDSSTELVKTRNWIKEHSIKSGAKRHWQIDDNIKEFFRYNNNKFTVVDSGTIFRCIEDFSDRYENVAISGMQYLMFVSRRAKQPPVAFNTRIYSCSLILNSIPYEWRGIYNDDTDICLRAMKDGWCTALFNAFVCRKSTTMTVKGGNTDIYGKNKSGRKEDDGRWLMADSLLKQHPDVTTIVHKWGRWQHHVDYRPFKKNKLIRKKDVKIQSGINNYGMVFNNDTRIKNKKEK